MTPEPFFRKQGNQYLATQMSRGPWSNTMLHGRVIAGLLAFQIERDYGDPEMMPARLTVDMYRPPDFSPVNIETKLVRDGHRIKVVDAEFFSAGKSMGRASCQMLRRTANSPGNLWMPPTWNVPPPEACGPDQKFDDGREPVWRIRNISGG